MPSVAAPVQPAASVRLPRVDLERFDREGFLVMKRVFTAAEVEDLRQRAHLQCDLDRALQICGNELPLREVSAPYGDLLSKEHLRHVVLDPRILHAARVLLEGDPLYFGFSSFQIGGIAFRSPRYVWHRDNRICDHNDPQGLDWQGQYPLLRFGIYLQDHGRHSGGLAVRIGTHRDGLAEGKAINVKSEPGDLIAWNMRISHAGQAVRLRFLPNLVANDWLGKVPPYLRRREQRERVVLFLTFGRRGEHLDRYLEYITARADMQDFWSRARFSGEVWEMVRASGLEVLSPYPDYGTPGTPPPLPAERRQPLETAK